jgi:hypothetical protein
MQKELPTCLIHKKHYNTELWKSDELAWPAFDKVYFHFRENARKLFFVKFKLLGGKLVCYV